MYVADSIPIHKNEDSQNESTIFTRNTDKLNKLVSFGGEGKQIHFAHANAYPVKSYSHFLRLFTDEFEVFGMHQRPCWPGSDYNAFTNWDLLGDDLVEILDAHEMKSVVGMGHSMGGIATLVAANKRPDLFSCIILIDPVIMDREMIKMIKQMPYEQQVANNPMAQIAMKRRNSWENKSEALAYFESKSFFQKFTPEAKQTFLDYGLQEVDNKITLRYSREWESKIYSVVPDVWAELEKLDCPALIVKAEKSDVIRTKEQWNMIKEVTSSATCLELEDSGHLIPQEKPVELKHAIIDFLNTHSND